MEILEAARLQIIHGDDDSSDTPILFGQSSVRTRTLAERLYMERRFGEFGKDWTEEMHYTSIDRQSVWVIQLATGTQKSVFFDTANTTYD